jgi:predicted N-acetyltransferase YhbS
VQIIPYAETHQPALARLAAATLDLPEDAGEGDAVVRRLLDPPPGRRTARLVAVDPSGTVSGAVLASLRDREPDVGHLDLIAVDPAARRRGIGRALVTAAEESLRGLGAREIRVAGNDPCYAWPGIDVRYTPAICLALALGYEQYATGWNMTADLSTIGDVAPEEVRLAAAGIATRAATPEDGAAIGAFAAANFGEGWSWELREAIARGAAGEAAGCHVALRDGEVLGFAGYGALRPSLFGPMGTAPAARGSGIGDVLLRRCLLDQRAAGLATAQISWAGPVAFYSRTVGARIGRVFLLYRRSLYREPL